MACHKGRKGPYDVAQSKRERRHGVLDVGIQGELVSTGELHHDVGEGEGESVPVLLGWAWP